MPRNFDRKKTLDARLTDCGRDGGGRARSVLSGGCGRGGRGGGRRLVDRVEQRQQRFANRRGRMLETVQTVELVGRSRCERRALGRRP